jgi:hypothetical protein
MTALRPFRFGVNMVVPESRAKWVEKCRRAEQLGYDVIGVPITSEWLRRFRP